MRVLALFLTVLTGFSGLVYEVTWQKGLAILLGSHSEATAAVLAIFLGGLSLGYASTASSRRASVSGRWSGPGCSMQRAPCPSRSRSGRTRRGSPSMCS